MSSEISLRPKRYKVKWLDKQVPYYDAIVDRSEFKIGIDKERDTLLAQIGATNSSSGGVYDFPDGQVTDDKSPTDIQLALRSGQLDKADVDTLQRSEQAKAEQQGKENLSKQEKKRAKAIQDARQSHIDSRLGFDANSVPVPSE